MSKAIFNIVLVKPEIPQNTGNIGRLCVCVGCRLHLIKPLGFSLEDRYVTRAGMDYWGKVDLRVHDRWENFLVDNQLDAPGGEERMTFLSTRAERTLWDADYAHGAFLVFGNESSGLPEALHERYEDRFRTIPMPGNGARSLNLANGVAVATYEALRRTRPLPGEGGQSDAVVPRAEHLQRTSSSVAASPITKRLFVNAK